jgi:hypothetical protein
MDGRLQAPYASFKLPRRGHFFAARSAKKRRIVIWLTRAASGQCARAQQQLATTNRHAAVSPPPNLSSFVEGQTAAARFYILLTLTYVVFGLSLLAMPMLFAIPQEEIRMTLRIGGGLVAALGAFPSTKYLQRRDRVFALRMISSEYDRLQVSGLLTSPARQQLDRMYMRLLQGMIR